MTEQNKIKIDEILKQNQALEAQKGIDVVGADLAEINRKQALLMLEIRDIDIEFYNVIEPVAPANPENFTL